MDGEGHIVDPGGRDVLVTILITGAAGFIGSNLVRHLLERWQDREVVSLDALTYAGHLANLKDVIDDDRHTFVKGDITDRETVRSVLETYGIEGVIHLAAESHVDRSIEDPMTFVRTNVEGTVVLLQEAARAWKGRDDVRFHHVSTDEVFGSLGPAGAFRETTPYAPNSPYSASKASADHFVRAWHETYGLPIVLTNCSNNYGPYQHPEKLIPVIITRALAGESVPVYGQGSNVRDWLFVEDHCDALALVFESGRDGRSYGIGGETEMSNLDLVNRVLDTLDRERGLDAGVSRSLIEFVDDRPGHDLRYAMDIDRIREELDWAPRTPLEEGLALTVRWYLEHRDWTTEVMEER